MPIDKNLNTEKQAKQIKKRSLFRKRWLHKWIEYQIRTNVMTSRRVSKLYLSFVFHILSNRPQLSTTPQLVWQPLLLIPGQIFNPRFLIECFFPSSYQLISDYFCSSRCSMNWWVDYDLIRISEDNNPVFKSNFSN